VSLAQNLLNQSTKARKHSKSGIKGINFDKKRKTWKALLSINGKLKHLGYFKCPLLAGLEVQRHQKHRENYL